MSRLWWFAVLPLLFVAPTIRAESPRATVSPEEAKRQIEACLKLPVEVNFHETPLREVIDTLRAEIKVPIVVDEPALEEDGVSLDRPLTIKLEGISAKSTLNLVLHQVHLSYLIEDGKVTITTERYAHRKPVWIQHSIADLLPTEADYVEEHSSVALMELMMRTCAPNRWNDVGGVGEIEYQSEEKTLFVFQTPDVQEQIGDVLDALRRLDDRCVIYCRDWWPGELVK